MEALVPRSRPAATAGPAPIPETAGQQPVFEYRELTKAR
jgi:hypothetical protein